MREIYKSFVEDLISVDSKHASYNLKAGWEARENTQFWRQVGTDG
jgi:hypothetical protein